MYQISSHLDKSLRDFTDSLIPPDEYITLVTRLAEKVLNVLKQKSKFSIDRIIYGGSLGKGTEILAPDVDLVAILNGEMPPFEDVLEDWEDILIMNEGLRVDPKSIKRSAITLQFKFLGDNIEVDLLPASNLANFGGSNPGGYGLAAAQKSGAMGQMDNRNFEQFSSSLTESQVGFMKEQSAFAHQVVRLAKFWYKTLYLGDKPIYGIKSTLELLAVSAAIKEQGRDQSMLRTFLDDVAKINRLKLAFHKDSGEWQSGNTAPTGYHHSHNFIIEPSNPFNNLATNFRNREKEVDNLMKFAKITRGRFDTAVNLGHISVNDLFQPQPKPLLPTISCGVNLPKVISGTDPNFRRYHPDMVVNNEKNFKMPQKSGVIDAMKNFLYSSANSAAASLAASGSTVTLVDVKKNTEKMISEDLNGSTYTPWSSCSDRHEDYDVTFTIPIIPAKELGGLKISFKWD